MPNGEAVGAGSRSPGQTAEPGGGVGGWFSTIFDAQVPPVLPQDSRTFLLHQITTSLPLPPLTANRVLIPKMIRSVVPNFCSLATDFHDRN
jgi:hypothetical protein